MTPKTHWSENPFVDNGDTVTADNGSSVSFFKKIATGLSKDWLLGLFMAISIIEGAALFFEIRHKDVTEDLKRYDFEYFKQNDWVHMQTDVEVTKQLIAAKCSK